MTPTDAAYNVDWVFSMESNVHVATHIDWFKTLTLFGPFKTSTLETYHDSSPISGIGDVELRVKTRPGRSTGRGDSNTILSRNVLYIPQYTMNVLGGPILDYYDCHIDGAVEGLRYKDGSIAGLFDHVVFRKLWLVGQYRGQSSLDIGVLHFVNAMWMPAEQDRWEEYKLLKKRLADDAPYTSDEKQ